MARTEIPFLNIFEKNPLGTLIAVFLLFMLFLFWQSNLATNPFASETNFKTAVWGTLYNNTNYLLTMAIPFFFIAMIMHRVRQGEGETDEEDGVDLRSVRVPSIGGRLLSARPDFGKIRSRGNLTERGSPLDGKNHPAVFLRHEAEATGPNARAFRKSLPEP